MSESAQLLHLWKQILEKAEMLIASVSFNAFIKDLEPVDVIGRKIVLRTSSDLIATTIMKKHAEKLREAIVKCDLGLSDFRLVVEGSSEFTVEFEEDAAESFRTAPIIKTFTFDSFVAGSGSKLAYAAAKAVAENPGEVFNPLFIYGESGLGKTHLLHAIANHIAKNHPEKKVLYTTSENFVNDLIDCIAQKNNAKFRYHYRNVDVLMIDDIQFLRAKERMQEEFFHTFNELTAQNKQIILTSDRPPREIPTLEERLRTRFEGGMIADVQPPDSETKIAILKRKALDKKCPISDEVLEFLARDSGHDVRTLEGRLTKVIFASRLHEEPITLSLARKALNDAVGETEEEEDATPEKIISAVCGYYKITKEELVGKSKKADLVKARQVCAYLMCDMLSMPLELLGKKYLDRDHTTIMYARDKMKKLASLNDKVAKEIDDIRNIVLKK